MKTPICDFINKYASSDALRLHMPGHKGISHTGCEECDITEIPGADVLYCANGIIKQSEENASALFGTAKTLYSTEGSSLSIRAMLYLTVLYRKNKKCKIAAARNAHRVFITAAALLNIEVIWLFPENTEDITSCKISPEYLEKCLTEMKEMPDAVYITSPDYSGNTADINGIAAVCKKNGCLLLTDNAHGAYLNFLPKNKHPIALGADMCCDSAHKTLPVLTGGGYLHISNSAPAFFSETAERAMAMFASTSPSYLILRSLDTANKYLSDGYREKLQKAVALWDDIKKELQISGIELSGDEPLKLTVKPKCMGYTGIEFAELLEKKNILVEFADPDIVVMMLSPDWDISIAKKIKKELLSIQKRTPITTLPPIPAMPIQVISPTEAIFSTGKHIKTTDAVGKIMASAAVTCPPAIPIVSCGELITENAVKAMLYYGIYETDVIS